MFAALFRLLFRLLALVFLISIGTAIWVVCDGLNDQGDHADLAVVLGNAIKNDGTPGTIVQARLDRAVDLYRAGTFPLIIVSGAQEKGGQDEASGMSRYLISRAVPADAIIEDHQGINTAATARDVAAIMRARGLTTVMVITHYYHITRTKLALRHEGIRNIEQAHAGVAQKEDAFHLGREIVAIYYYLAKYYLPPFTAQAKIDAEKAKVEMQQATDKAKQEIDTLHK